MEVVQLGDALTELAVVVPLNGRDGEFGIVGAGDVDAEAIAAAPLVAAVKRAGIRQVEGGLWCDESRYSGPPFGSGWNWDDLVESYGAAVSALSAGDNVVSLIVTPGRVSGEPAVVRMEPLATAMSLESVVVTSTAPEVIELALHEMGHTLGLLGDEYSSSPPACSNGSEPPYANIASPSTRSGGGSRAMWQWTSSSGSSLGKGRRPQGSS